MSLDTEVKGQWVTALRSGDFKQGRERLRTDTDEGPLYCCLGVLAEIRPELKFDENGCAVYDVGDEEILITRDFGHLPDRYLTDIGLRDAEQSTLIAMNDGYDEQKGEHSSTTAKSFAEIADYIEQTL